MLAGTSEATNFDHQANIAATNAKLVQQKKNRKRNEDVFRLVNEFMFRIKESPMMSQLKARFGHADLQSIFDVIQLIEEKINETYEGTENLLNDLMLEFPSALFIYAAQKD